MYYIRLHSGKSTKYKINHMSGLHPFLLTTFQTEIAQQNARNRKEELFQKEWRVKKNMLDYFTDGNSIICQK